MNTPSRFYGTGDGQMCIVFQKNFAANIRSLSVQPFPHPGNGNEIGFNDAFSCLRLRECTCNKRHKTHEAALSCFHMHELVSVQFKSRSYMLKTGIEPDGLLSFFQITDNFHNLLLHSNTFCNYSLSVIVYCKATYIYCKPIRNNRQ